MRVELTTRLLPLATTKHITCNGTIIYSTLGSNWQGGPVDVAKTTRLAAGLAQKRGGRCTARASQERALVPRCAHLARA
jgi:hypothetical protein